MSKRDPIKAEPDNYPWPEPAPESDFEFNSEKGLLTKYIGNESVVVVPEKIDGTVVRVVDSAFENNTTVTHVKLSEGVKRLSRAFYFTENLEHVSLPESLEVIGLNSFYSNGKLSKLVIPHRVFLIDDSGLLFGQGLKRLTFLGEAPAFGKNPITVDASSDPEVYVADEAKPFFDEILNKESKADGSENVADRAPKSGDFEFDA